MSDSETPPKKPYEKPWLSLSQQIKKLKSRGLVIEDDKAAEAFLHHVNYYRFTGYCLAFEKPRHSFPDGVTFEKIQYAYSFDLKLRQLIRRMLDWIEIDLRTSVAYDFGEAYGPFGHTNPNNFHYRFGNKRDAKKPVTHADWLQDVRDEATRPKKEKFVDHFEKEYSEFPDLPVWVATEIITFGKLARMVRGMKGHDRKRIAEMYGLSAKLLSALILHLSYVRNLCAHHSRIWDRHWSVPPLLPRDPDWSGLANERLFSSLLFMRHLTQASPVIADDGKRVCDELTELLSALPDVENAAELTGLPTDWKNHPVWIQE
jgi:abortive infection bacteriophage resistance protein